MKRMLSILIVLALGMALGLGPATAGDKTAEIVYVEWSCATASANVVKAVLETKMGYDVELTPVSAAAMWQALATGVSSTS